MQELQRPVQLLLADAHLGGLPLEVREFYVGLRAQRPQLRGRRGVHVHRDTLLPRCTLWRFGGIGPRVCLHPALLRQPLEHGVAERHLHAHVQEQPLVLHQRCQRFPQRFEAVPRLAAHAVAEEDAGSLHALLAKALQPLFGLVASVLLAAMRDHARLNLLHLVVQRCEAS